MSGFNFGQISDVVSNVMDSDFIDIKRDSGGKLEEVYSNVPCHLAFNSTDNPDPNSVDTKPIIQSINVHCVRCNNIFYPVQSETCKGADETKRFTAPFVILV